MDKFPGKARAEILSVKSLGEAEGEGNLKSMGG